MSAYRDPDVLAAQLDEARRELAALRKRLSVWRAAVRHLPHIAIASGANVFGYVVIAAVGAFDTRGTDWIYFLAPHPYIAAALLGLTAVVAGAVTLARGGVE